MPRHLYWTIIAGGVPTAFRSRERDDLLPTLKQLQRQHPDVMLMWFERGRLWESPQQARAQYDAEREQARRPPGWRPGGEHRDPREKYKKKPRDVRRREQMDRWRQEGAAQRPKAERDRDWGDRRPPGPAGERVPRAEGQRPDRPFPRQAQRPDRPPRPEGQRWDRPPRPEGPRPERPPRPEGLSRDRPPRPEGQRWDRPPRPEGQRPERPPRSEGPRGDRPPRFENQRPDRPPRPEGQRWDRPPHPEGQRQDRPPRPTGKFGDRGTKEGTSRDDKYSGFRPKKERPQDTTPRHDDKKPRWNKPGGISQGPGKPPRPHDERKGIGKNREFSGIKQKNSNRDVRKLGPQRPKGVGAGSRGPRGPGRRGGR